MKAKTRYFSGAVISRQVAACEATKAAREISEHPACDALCVSNTLPWGSLPEYIDWRELFGSEVSPLADIGGGGLSGKPLLWRVIDWLRVARSERGGIRKPINAGGGILSLRDAQETMRAGADSIFLGSIAILRPWRVRGIITHFSQAAA
jgi:dihydroorotate dehydrogenase